MKARLNYVTAAPGAYKAMLGLEQYLHDCGLEGSLIHLIKLRASQINGCAYCLDLHWKDLRALGETEQPLYSFGRLARMRVVQRQGIVRPDARRGDDQRLESPGHCGPYRARHVRAGPGLFHLR